MGFGGGSTGSSQNQSQGLLPHQRNYFSNLAPGEFTSLKTLSNFGQRDPGGLDFMESVDKVLPIGKYGLSTSATEGVSQLGRDLYSQYSGSRSGRGFNAPENLEGVIGDAVRAAAPQLIPLATNLAMERARLASQFRQSSFGYGSAPFKAIRDILGSTSEGSGGSSGFNAEAHLW